MTTASSYRAASLAILGLCAYALALPFFSPMLSRAFPDVWRCAYQSATGKPCVFCGMTRDFERITAGDVARARQRNALSLPVFIGLLGETLWRVGALARLSSVKNLVRFIRIDAALHAALLAVFLFIAFEQFTSLQLRA